MKTMPFSAGVLELLHLKIEVSVSEPCDVIRVLKRHNQAKIIKKSVFLFFLPDMSKICQHVHRLEFR